ncbi:MAG TPA: cytidylate kinase-like family protein [Phycisphaerae bacterium]|nr:cytidylate kinase-like family protein [Phycisphaerae bacterium]
MVLGKGPDLRQLIGALRTRGGVFESHGEEVSTRPFITISRQAGAGGHTLARGLVERLNRLAHSSMSVEDSTSGAQPWQSFDRELVERIGRDHHLSTELIESLERSSHTWLEEFFRGLGHTDSRVPGELAIVRRAAQTIRALAQGGYVVLVGLGGVFITHNMPGGIHIRVVAPLEARVQWEVKSRNITEKQARREIEIMDAERDAFFRKYWPNKQLAPELFHIALNSGMMNEEQMVDCVLPLVKPLIAGSRTVVH